MWNAAKADLAQNYFTDGLYFKNKRFQINDLSFYLRNKKEKSNLNTK